MALSTTPCVLHNCYLSIWQQRTRGKCGKGLHWYHGSHLLYSIHIRNQTLNRGMHGMCTCTCTCEYTRNLHIEGLKFLSQLPPGTYTTDSKHVRCYDFVDHWLRMTIYNLCWPRKAVEKCKYNIEYGQIPHWMVPVKHFNQNTNRLCQLLHSSIAYSVFSTKAQLSARAKAPALQTVSCSNMFTSCTSYIKALYHNMAGKILLAGNSIWQISSEPTN